MYVIGKDDNIVALDAATAGRFGFTTTVSLESSANAALPIGRVRTGVIAGCSTPPTTYFAPSTRAPAS